MSSATRYPAPTLFGLRIACLAHPGADRLEARQICACLRAAGARVEILAPRAGRCGPPLGPADREREEYVAAASFGERLSADYDALMILGGAHVQSEWDPEAARLAREFDQEGKPIGARSEGVGLLIAAGLTRGRSVCAPTPLKNPLEASGGQWLDQDIAIERGWISCPEDTDPELFCSFFIHALQERANKLGLHPPSWERRASERASRTESQPA